MDSLKVYHLFAVNDRTGKREQLTGFSVTISEAYTMKGKFNPSKDVRLLVERNYPIYNPFNL